MEILTQYVLPVVGIAMIIFSLLSLFFPFGLVIRDKVQKFSGFGVNFEISLLSLFLLLGTAFSVVGIYINLRQDNGKIDHLEGQIKILQENLEQSQKNHMTILLKLVGATSHETDDLSKWECTYSTVGTARLAKGILERGPAETQFSVTLLDINPSTVIQGFSIANLATRRKWGIQRMFAPLQPTYELQQEPQP